MLINPQEPAGPEDAPATYREWQAAGTAATTPSPERLRNDLKWTWREKPYFHFDGATVPNEDDHSAGMPPCAAVEADEADLCPNSWFRPLRLPAGSPAKIPRKGP